MLQIWHMIIQGILDHPKTILTGFAVIMYSFVNNWPEHVPTTFQDYWTWARNSCQSAVPMKQAIRTAPVNPISAKENQI